MYISHWTTTDFAMSSSSAALRAFRAAVRPALVQSHRRLRLFDVHGRTLTAHKESAPGIPQVANLMVKLRDKYGNKFDHRLQNVDATYKYLVDRGARDDAVMDMFVRQPTLGQVPLHRWRAVVDRDDGVLGFLPIDALVSLMAACPQIVTHNRKELMAVLDVLRRAEFNDRQVSSLLKQSPTLLVTSPSDIAERLGRLKSLVSSGEQSLCDAVLICPNLCFDDWNAIEDTVSYATSQIGCDRGQLVASKLLRHSADHVELRHRLMSLCGQLGKLRTSRGFVASDALAQMVDTDVGDFVAFAGIGREEYDVFRAIHEIEKRHDVTDSDDD